MYFVVLPHLPFFPAVAFYLCLPSQDFVFLESGNEAGQKINTSNEMAQTLGMNENKGPENVSDSKENK